MDRHIDLSLLQDALAYLTMPAPFLTTRRRRLLRHALIDRIRAQLREQDLSVAGRRAVAFARAQLATERLRVEPDEDQVRETADVLWVRAWARVDRDEIAAPPTPQMRERYIGAVNALPHFTREIFLLLRVDRLGYDAIATRLGIARTEVEEHVRAALAHISLVLEPKDRDP